MSTASTRQLGVSPADLAVVFGGGALGTLGRWAVAQGPLTGIAATLLVNLTGAFLLGLLLAWLAGWPDVGWRRRLRLGAGTGVLGAWTSYSALAVGTVELGSSAGAASGLGYLALTVLGGLLACWLGIRVGRRARP